MADPDHARHLAADLRRASPALVERFMRAFCADHPEWCREIGERGLAATSADTAHNLDFLASAVELQSAEAFEEYVGWTRRVLDSRGVRGDSLQVGLRVLADVLGEELGAADWEAVRPILARGIDRAGIAGHFPGTEVTSAGAMAESRHLFRTAILAGNRRAALTLAREALRAGTDVYDLYVDVLQGALYDVGALWESNRITVAEEHMATAITQYVLAELYSLLPLTEGERGRAVVTGIEGELHQVGANMVADLLESDGWDVRFLGANVPLPGVIKALGAHGASILGISVTMLVNAPRVADLIAAVRRSFGAAVKIAVGGGAFRFSPQAPAQLGADGYAPDLRAAITLFRGLAG